MATNRTRRTRTQGKRGGISEADYIYFSAGPFFEAENYEDGKSEEELRAFWLEHREAIIERHHHEYPHHGDPWPVEKWEVNHADE